VTKYEYKKGPLTFFQPFIVECRARKTDVTMMDVTMMDVRVYRLSILLVIDPDGSLVDVNAEDRVLHQLIWSSEPLQEL